MNEDTVSSLQGTVSAEKRTCFELVTIPDGLAVFCDQVGPVRVAGSVVQQKILCKCVDAALLGAIFPSAPPVGMGKILVRNRDGAFLLTDGQIIDPVGNIVLGNQPPVSGCSYSGTAPVEAFPGNGAGEKQKLPVKRCLSEAAQHSGWNPD